MGIGRQEDTAQEHAAMVADGGKVTPVEGNRLSTLSEAVRRCIERVRGTQ